MHIASIGIDLGKTTFHLVALGEHNKVVIRKKFSRAQLLAYTANLPSSLNGLEACAGAHFMGIALRERGHKVRLIPAGCRSLVWLIENASDRPHLGVQAPCPRRFRSSVAIRTSAYGATVWRHQGEM